MDLSRFRHSNPAQSTKDLWDWWLSDEPPSATARQEIRRKKVERASAYQPRGLSIPAQVPAAAVPLPSGDVKSVVINLRLPKLELNRLKEGGYHPLAGVIRHYKTWPKIMSAFTLLLILFVISKLPSSSAPSAAVPQTKSQTAAASATDSSQIKNVATLSNNAAAQSGASNVSQPSSTSPSVLAASTSPPFTPVAPAGEQQLTSPTTGRTAYNSDGQIYTIMDSFGGSITTINEEAITGIPQTAVQQAATSVDALQPISLANGSTAYLTKVGADGFQSAVFAVGKVLIVANSHGGHSAADWQTYINGFR